MVKLLFLRRDYKPGSGKKDMGIEIRKCGLVQDKGKDSVHEDIRNNIIKNLQKKPMSFQELRKICETDRIILVDALKELIEEKRISKKKDKNRLVFLLN
jgi:predicted transcriptional regulator